VSHENVEVVREWYASLLDRMVIDPTEEAGLVDRAFRDYLDEDFELWLPDYPEGEPRFRGREGVGQYVAWLRGAWFEWRFEVERLLCGGQGGRVRPHHR
jgi:ketosteroid isomerase-like protein